MKTILVGMVPGLLVTTLVISILDKMDPSLNESEASILILFLLFFFFTWLFGKMILSFFRKNSS